MKKCPFIYLYISNWILFLIYKFHSDSQSKKNMATTEPKKRGITGKLVANMLTEREDDFTYNVTYVANRSVSDLCKLAFEAGSKFSASELESAYNDLFKSAKEELYSASTVEFGFTYNSLGVEGSFIGPKAQFDPTRNKVIMRSSPRQEIKEDLKDISVIVSAVEEGLPTIISVTDVTFGVRNAKLTPGGGLNGTSSRAKIVGEEGKPVGFFFVNSKDDTETAVPMTSVLRNAPSSFSLIIPALANSTYYLEVATQFGGSKSQMLKDVRRNRFPYPLTVGGPDSESPGEI